MFSVRLVEQKIAYLGKLLVTVWVAYAQRCTVNNLVKGE